MSAVFTTVRARHLAWFPAALLAAWGLLAAAGVPLAPDSRAASSTGTTSVTATVSPEVHVGGTCIGSTYSGVSMLTTAGDTDLHSACTVTFGTNNGTNGATLRVRHSRPSPNVAFCQNSVYADACLGDTFTDVVNTGVAAGSMPEGSFGVGVTAVTACTTPTWAAGNVYGLRDITTAGGVGDLVCTQSGNTDGNYSIQFRADPSNSETAGSYYAQAQFVAEAS